MDERKTNQDTNVASNAPTLHMKHCTQLLLLVEFGQWQTKHSQFFYSFFTNVINKYLFEMTRHVSLHSQHWKISKFFACRCGLCEIHTSHFTGLNFLQQCPFWQFLSYFEDVEHDPFSFYKPSFSQVHANKLEFDWVSTLVGVCFRSGGANLPQNISDV